MKAIITFHCIDDDGGLLSYSPAQFSNLLDCLAEQRIPVLPLDQLLRSDIHHGVCLTFDDGMASVFENALPIMRERGAPAHLFLTTAAVGGSNQWSSQPKGAPVYPMLDWNQLETLNKNGVLIDAHTHSHPDLRDLPDDAIREEFQRCDEAITSRLGRAPEYFAYPYGFLDHRVERLASEHYHASMTTRLGYLRARDRISALPRLDSYYLKPKLLARDLFSYRTRSYIDVRAAMRAVRGKFWNTSHA
jgi:peptidoglycan/xylan/chitin deacetylase (PgdA/CDA1 family)